FQAEDGIRAFHVTGVQTCALPIWKLVVKVGGEFGYLGTYNNKIGTIPFERFYLGGTGLMGNRFDGREIVPLRGYDDSTQSGGTRSEERRVGKERRSPGCQARARWK